jgi:hypothetical protein
MTDNGIVTIWDGNYGMIKAGIYHVFMSLVGAAPFYYTNQSTYYEFVVEHFEKFFKNTTLMLIFAGYYVFAFLITNTFRLYKHNLIKQLCKGILWIIIGYFQVSCGLLTIFIYILINVEPDFHVSDVFRYSFLTMLRILIQLFSCIMFASYAYDKAIERPISKASYFKAIKAIIEILGSVMDVTIGRLVR